MATQIILQVPPESFQEECSQIEPDAGLVVETAETASRKWHKAG